MLGRTTPKNLQPIYLSSYVWTTYTLRMKGLSLLKESRHLCFVQAGISTGASFSHPAPVHLVYLVCLVFWLNETNQMNQINQINKTNQAFLRRAG